MLNLARIRAITLDLDGTLWPTWPVLKQAHGMLWAWVGERAPGTLACTADAEALGRLREQVRANHPAQAHDPSAIMRALIATVLQRGGGDPALAAPAFDLYYQARQQVQPFADTLPALATLARRYTLVALTNGNADVDLTSVGPYFSGKVSPATAGVAKPDAAIFHAAADVAGMRPDQVLHVGDDPALDCSAAHAVGMQVAWLNRTQAVWPESTLPHPQAHVSDMQQLSRLLVG